MPVVTRAAIVQGTESCLKVRRQPSVDAPAAACLPEGTEIALEPPTSGSEPRWWKVEGGWVAGEFLKRTRAVVVGTDACLNVRESPSTTAARLGCLPEGAPVKIVDGPTTGDGFAWYQIEPTGSLERPGWVVGQYLD
jgi:hypothetical protein